MATIGEKKVRPKVFIIGGANKVTKKAIGYFLEKDFNIIAMSLFKDNMDEFKGNPRVKLVYGDVFKTQDNDIFKLMYGADYMIIACSKTPKNIPLKPASEYFNKFNVIDTDNLLRLARLAKVKKVCIMGSVYAYFDKLHPQSQLAERHPYIASRVAQEELALSSSGVNTQVMVLRLPIILGKNFKHTPLYDTVAMQIYENKPVYTFNGIGSFCTVDEAAQALVNLYDIGIGGKAYNLITANIDWSDIIKIAKDYMGNNRGTVNLTPRQLRKFFRVQKRLDKREGLENGFDLNYYEQLITGTEIVRTQEMKKFFNIKEDDLRKALYQTIENTKKQIEANLKHD